MSLIRIRSTLLHFLFLVFLAAVFIAELSTTALIHAEDSVIGLPTANDSDKLGAVVLHGGGRITEDVFDRFVELAGGKQAEIVFVPSAGYSQSDFASRAEFQATVTQRYGSWPALVAQKRIAKFQFLDTADPSAANNSKFVSALESATGVWFSGGRQSRLNYRYVGRFPEMSRFQKALRGVLERGGVVGGTSAGTAALPEVMTLWDEREDADAPAMAVPAHGLGLFDRAIVEQHFDARSGRLERFTRLLRDSPRLDELSKRKGSGDQTLGFAVEERAALIVQGNNLEVLGAANVHVFLKSNAGLTVTWEELFTNSKAKLHRDDSGTTRLIRKP